MWIFHFLHLAPSLSLSSHIILKFVDRMGKEHVQNHMSFCSTEVVISSSFQIFLGLYFWVLSNQLICQQERICTQEDIKYIIIVELKLESEKKNPICYQLFPWSICYINLPGRFCQGKKYFFFPFSHDILQTVPV